MTPRTIGEVLGPIAYPGRGLVVGLTPDGTRAALAYFLTGRSANSRNREFVEEDGAIRTRPVDLSLVSDPSLIIYTALRVVGGATILTNGDQTDTIAEALATGGTFEAALRTRDYEPDGPNWTSRISALVLPSPDGLAYRLAQLRRATDGTTVRAFWEYEGAPGVGRLLRTYAGDGDPLPAFTGDPVDVAVSDDEDAWTRAGWDALDADNRIALATRFIPLAGGTPVTRLVNRFGTTSRQGETWTR